MMNSSTEIWKDVVGYESIYQVSSMGRVKSSERAWVATNTIVVKPELILNPHFDKNGYVTLMLSVNNIQKRIKVHRLVAIAFIPNPENKPHVNHINGIKHDNRVENLEWCTNKENSRHARETGLVNDYGENSVNSLLSNKDVVSIISLYRTGLYSQQDVSLMFHVSIGAISSILIGRSWKSITNGERIFDRKIVLDTQTGIFYDSISKAAKAKGIPASSLTSMLNGRMKVNYTSIIKT